MQNPLKNKFFINLLIFLLCWLFYGIIANVWIQFPDWDWFNYQHYNAWAFLNNRIDIDFLAANFRSYFNPYINVFQYLVLLKLNLHPRIFLFLSTLDGAILLFLTVKVSQLLLEVSDKKRNLLIFLSVLYVALTPIMFEVMDFSRYDGYIAVFELLAFYILLKNIFNIDSKKRTLMIMLSGILVGIAAAFKLTAIVFCISFFICVLFIVSKIEKPLKILFIFTISTIISFLLIDGYWMYSMYQHFSNPIFPHFNNIFKSEYYDEIKILDSDFIHLRPKTLLQFAFYPFFKSNNFLCFGSDDKFWDARYAISIFCIAILPFISRFKSITLDKTYMFTCCFIFVSYYIDILIFSNYRYIMAISVLFGILLLKFISILLKAYNKFSCNKLICCFLLILIFVYANQNLGYRHFLPKEHSKVTKVLSIEDLGIKDDSYVFTTCATSAVISNQNKKAKYLGYELSDAIFNKRKVDLDEKTDLWFNAFYIHSKYLENEIREALNTSSNAYILINYKIWNNYMPVYKESLNSYSNSRRLKNCRLVSIKLFDNMREEWGIYFCEYSKQ